MASIKSTFSSHSMKARSKTSRPPSTAPAQEPSKDVSKKHGSSISNSKFPQSQHSKSRLMSNASLTVPIPSNHFFHTLQASSTLSELVRDTAKSNKSYGSSEHHHRPHQNKLTTKSSLGLNRSRSLRATVERAIRDHKIYAVIGVFPAIRRALNRRGWIEKSPNLGLSNARSFYVPPNESTDRGSYEEESDKAWIHRVLKDYPPDFIWTFRRDNVHWSQLQSNQLVNRHPKAIFTSKVGITSCLQNLHWFCEPLIAVTYFPRSYRLTNEEEKAAFLHDFRLTACMGLLKWVVGAYDRDGEKAIIDPSSRIPSLCVDFAIRQVNNYVRLRRHEDIDWLVHPSFSNQNWDLFIAQYYAVVLLKMKIAPYDLSGGNGAETPKAKVESAKRALQRIAPFWPQLSIDGTNDVWICKPGARSRGSGIVLMNNLEKILQLMQYSNGRETNWVVQKYIERPLLIYKTKFDIRQWFIVTDWSPLTVWFYKECYFRFCTKPFSIDDFHESIHLCNNAVQARYQNSDVRDTALPKENMWDNYTFQAYLKSIGKLDLWNTVIYPGMKQGILGVLLASQEHCEFRKNCFELYGADFMLSDDFTPWMIEINSSPCMASTTSVTSRMCGRCLEDIIKVVVDRRDSRSADTGMFELIYRQNVSPMPSYVFPQAGIISIQGRKLSRNVDWPGILTKYNSKRHANVSASRSVAASRMLAGLSSTHQQPPASAITLNNGMTFVDLIQRLRLKDAQKTSSTQQETPEEEALIPRNSASSTPSTATQAQFNAMYRQSMTESLVNSLIKSETSHHDVGPTRIIRRRASARSKSKSSRSSSSRSKIVVRRKAKPETLDDEDDYHEEDESDTTGEVFRPPTPESTATTTTVPPPPPLTMRNNGNLIQFEDDREEDAGTSEKYSDSRTNIPDNE